MNEEHATTVLGPWGAEGLGGACVRLGYATPEQVRECLDLQARAIERGEAAPRLGELLVERGYVTREQVARALSRQGQGILTCLRCRVQYNVGLDRPSAAALCARCHHPLRAMAQLDSVAVVEEHPILLPEEPLPADVMAAAREPSRRFGKYILLERLGQGGSGVVDQAWDCFLGQRVALKRLRGTDPELPSIDVWEARRILVEARSTIRLRHPSIVRIYDAGQIEQVHYISMEYVEGRSFEALIDEAARGGRISPYHEDPEKTLLLLAGVARALGYAHSRPAPVIHCDLKPSNIMIDLEGQPRLLDFGLARVLSPRSKAEMEICGTPGYMAPEQALGKTSEIDPRTDAYGFGALLYEALTGLAPFRGRADAVLRAVVEKTPAPPSEVLRELGRSVPGVRPRPIPAFLEDLCLRCLAKEKERRPASMLEICELLERAARPAPSPSLSATRVPDRRERRSAALRAAARRAVAALALAGVALAAAVSLRDAATSSAPAVDARDVEARLAAFQPDRALSLAAQLPGAERLRDEARRLGDLREALEARLPARVESLCLKGATLHDVLLEPGPLGHLKAGERIVAWSDLEPSQIVSLARSTGVLEHPEARFALALYCFRVGRRFDARSLLESLPSGALQAAARPYLAADAP